MLTKKWILATFLFVAIILQIQIASRAFSMPWLADTLLATAYSNSIPNNNATSTTNGWPVRLIIHVGSPKTATTSIQCTLAYAEKSGSLSKLLATKVVEVESCRPSVREARLRLDRYKEQFHLNQEDIMKNDEADNLATLPKVIKGGSFIPDCIWKWNDLKDDSPSSYPDCWGKSYLKYIQTHLNFANHSTFIISNEMLAGAFGKFTEQTCHHIWNDILTSLGDYSTIDIVYTHRMFLDYLISMHSQEYEGDKFTSKPALRKWVSSSEGGGPINLQKSGQHTPDLVKYVTQKMKVDFDLWSNSMKCLRLGSSNNQQVNFHMIDYNGSSDGGGDVLTSFFNILAGGNDTLASDLIDGAYQRRENVASSKNILIPADRIALVAYTKDLIPKDANGQVVLSRGTVRMAAKEVLDTLNVTIPIKYKCPHKLYQPLLDQLLEKTVQLEELAFPDRVGVREEISQKFKSAIDNDRLCDIDGHAMLRNDAFRSLLVEKFQKLR